jgi:hypothetical protein
VDGGYVHTVMGDGAGGGGMHHLSMGGRAGGGASGTAKVCEGQDRQLLTGVLPELPVLNALSGLGRTHG